MSAEPHGSIVPWPIAPRPSYEEAFGGGLGRVAARYQVSIAMRREMSASEPLPALGNCWMDFIFSDFTVSAPLIR